MSSSIPVEFQQNYMVGPQRQQISELQIGKFLRAIQGHSGGTPIMPELNGYRSTPHNWKECIFHRGCSWSVQSILESGLIPGGKESDKARQAVFFTTLNSFGENPDEEEPLMITQFFGKCIITVIGNGITMSFIG